MKSKQTEGEKIADAIRYATKWLGNADASTPMGAIEGHGVAIIEAARVISAALDNVADAIRENRCSK